jgi:hypothetical protein
LKVVEHAASLIESISTLMSMCAAVYEILQLWKASHACAAAAAVTVVLLVSMWQERNVAMELDLARAAMETVVRQLATVSKSNQVSTVRPCLDVHLLGLDAWMCICCA